MGDYREKTEQELLAIKRNKLAPSVITREIDTEFQRRQQETNTKQISILIQEVNALKDITNKSFCISAENTRNGNRLAKIAIILSTISVILQFLFSIHQKKPCSLRVIGNDGSDRQTNCSRIFDLGLFGEYSYKIPDILKPN